MFCFVESKHSSSCILKCDSSYLIIWGGVMSFLTIWVRVSWLTCCQEWENFKSTNLFIGFILCHVSPKAFPKECCYYGAYQWSKFFSYPLGERSFSLPWCSHSNQWLPLVAVCHLIMLRCFHKPTTNFFFSLLVFQQLRSILLHKDAL